MKKREKRKQETERSQRSARSVWIITVALIAALAFGIIMMIAAPYLKASRVLQDAAALIERLDGTVTLCDPYVIVDIMPEVKETALDRETASSLLSLLRSVMKNAEFVGRKQILGGISDPYVCVSGTQSVFVYVCEDSFQIEENSTFYRFSPKTSEEKAVYAEFYARTMQLLTSES
jgi:hypothetical protein